jgi:hypothetical protein
MSFNLNAPQWQPKVNRPQAAQNDGRGSGGGGGYASANGGDDFHSEEVKNNDETSIFSDEFLDSQSDVDSSVSNLFKLIMEKVRNFLARLS